MKKETRRLFLPSMPQGWEEWTILLKVLILSLYALSLVWILISLPFVGYCLWYKQAPTETIAKWGQLWVGMQVSIPTLVVGILWGWRRKGFSEPAWLMGLLTATCATGVVWLLWREPILHFFYALGLNEGIFLLPISFGFMGGLIGDLVRFNKSQSPKDSLFAP